jgi:hypothetical protein
MRVDFASLLSYWWLIGDPKDSRILLFWLINVLLVRPRPQVGLLSYWRSVAPKIVFSCISC